MSLKLQLNKGLIHRAVFKNGKLSTSLKEQQHCVPRTKDSGTIALNISKQNIMFNK